MNIIFVGGYDTPDFGGINSYMLCLSQQLERMGHSCLVIRRSNHNYETIIEGIKFVNLKTRDSSIGFAELYYKAANYIIKKKMQVDVVNFQNYFMAPIFGRKLERQGIKTCYTQHSFAIDNPKNSKMKGYISLFVCYVSCLFSNNLITVGQNLSQIIKKRIHKVPAIVRCGIFMPTDSKVSSSILNQINIEKDRYFLTISRIDPVKNLDVLIAGFKKYKGNKKLVIAGNTDNDYGQLLKELAADDKRIIFPGSVVNANKEMLLRNCFAYCLVSSSEGFPISLLEAMAYGKRCITSDIHPIVEALSEELGMWCKVGMSEDISDALAVMDEGKDRSYYENAIKKRVEQNFTWETSAKAFLSYIDIIG